MSMLGIRTALSRLQKELIPACHQFHTSAVREGGGKRPKKRPYTRPTSRTRLSEDVVPRPREPPSRTRSFKDSKNKGSLKTETLRARLNLSSPEKLEKSKGSSSSKPPSRTGSFQNSKSRNKGGVKTEILRAGLNSESPELSKKPKGQRQSNSKPPTRIASYEDMRSMYKGSSKVEIPPAEPKFSRDAAPHHGVPEKLESDEPFRPFESSRETWNVNRHYDRKLIPRQSYANNRWSRLRVSDRMKEIQERAAAEAARRRNTTPYSNHIRSPTENLKAEHPLKDEFDLLDASERPRRSLLPKTFTSPPLLEGLLASVSDILGPEKRPTEIQALSLQNLFEETPSWKQYLLAAETGSGKSIAYLLPVLQHLKTTEINPPSNSKADRQRAINPRALVLAPTHELSRQLTSFAKDLIHNIKLRVMCVSRANTRSAPAMSFTASKMAEQFQGFSGEGEFEVRKSSHRPVDLLVGTPNRLLEMYRGRGWDREENENHDNFLRTSNDRKTWRRRPPPPPELGLQNVEWVVVDEADVLFDADFQEYTRMLLADISAARGHPVEFTPNLLPSSETPKPKPIEYPFNYILTSATIPTSLTAYLNAYHPSLVRLASPNLHHLPYHLKATYTPWTGTNKDADIARRIRRVWAEDSLSPDFDGKRSKILIFCNRGTKVESLGAYLKINEIKNVALSGSSEARHIGSNKHLDGFLRVRERSSESVPSIPPPAQSSDDEPHVLITTSLLSRGLDFAPSVKHVFIVDEPRNMIDFLHRAGRSGRAGQHGNVVIFVNSEGRGSDRSRDIKKKIKAVKGIFR